MVVWKNTLLLGSLLLWSFILIGCRNTYELSLNNEVIQWNPKLDVAMQALPNEDEISLYQETGENTPLDTLIISSEYHQESPLASYVQQAINQFKTAGYELSNEKSKRTEFPWREASHQALLKTYQLTIQNSPLYIAQLFFEHNHEITVISYASNQASHTSTFVKQLKTLKFSF